jgi:hypothetical protein
MMQGEKERTQHGVAGAPCKSCPYRRDVPAGLWDASEYAKLPGYDGEIIEQLSRGATGLFLCHQQDENLCAGWLAAHGADNLLAMRLHGDQVSPSAWDYSTAVPVFRSGAAAARHGMAGVASPDARARRAIDRLLRKQAARAIPGEAA